MKLNNNLRRSNIMSETKALNVRGVPVEVMKAAQKRAIDEGKPLAQIVREYLERMAKQYNKTPAPQERTE
jgi:AAA+ superfamily predicted ATPase